MRNLRLMEERKKEEGRRKKEEGRRKKVEGRRNLQLMFQQLRTS
ncbi:MULTISPECIES: hypothetical protein [unclassified Microcoleus]